MLAPLHERIYLIVGLLVAVPATIYFLVVPLWKAQRDQQRTIRSPHVKSHGTRTLVAFVLGTLNGWIAFRLLPETLFLGVIFGTAFAVVALAWYLAISANAFQLGSWHPFFGFGRPVPAEMAKSIQAPVALPGLLFLAGGLLGLVLHMLSVAGA